MELNRDDYKYTNLAGSGTTQIASGRGRLIRIVVNTSAAAAVTVIDNTTGTTPPIASIAASAPIGTVFYYGVTFTTGLRIVAAGATDLTVVWTPN